MTNHSDVLANIKASLQQAIERKKPREQVGWTALREHWRIYILFRPWSSNLIVKSEPVVYRSPSLTTICWSQSSICLGITLWRASRVFNVCSHAKMAFVYRSPVTKIFRKWSPSLRWMEHRNWTFYWHERKVRHHRVAKWSERMTNQRR